MGLTYDERRKLQAQARAAAKRHARVRGKIAAEYRRLRHVYLTCMSIMKAHVADGHPELEKDMLKFRKEERASIVRGVLKFARELCYDVKTEEGN